MSKAGIDKVLSGGNLSMAQVLTMFQNQVKLAIVKKHNPAIGDAVSEVSDEEFINSFEHEIGYRSSVASMGSDIEAKYGRLCPYYSGETATNEYLKAQVREFIKNYGPNQQITLLFNRIDGDEAKLERQIFSNVAHLNSGTHWTTLSLASDADGKLIVSYADSLVDGDALPRIPDKIETALGEVFSEKEIDFEFKGFASSMQTGADCGYYAVWHALRMRGLPVNEDPKEFVRQQKVLLLGMGQDGTVNKSSSSSAASSVPLFISPIKKINFGTRLKGNRTFERDADDSSDDEAVEEKVFGALKEESAEREGGYDLNEEWESFKKSNPDKEYVEKAFIVHAFGVGLLYSSEVEDKYYGSQDRVGLKKKYLSDTRKVGEVKLVIEKKLDKLVESVTNLFFDDVDEANRKEIIELLRKKIAEAEDGRVVDNLILIVGQSLSEILLKKIENKGLDFVGKKQLRELQRRNDYYFNGEKYKRCEELGFTLRDSGDWYLEEKNGKKWLLKLDGNLYESETSQIIARGKRYYSEDGKRFGLSYNANKQDEIRLPFIKGKLIQYQKEKKLLQNNLLGNIDYILKQQKFIEESESGSAVISPHKIAVSVVKWKSGLDGVLGNRGLAKSIEALKLGAKKGGQFEPMVRDSKVLEAYFDDLQNSPELFADFITAVLINAIAVSKTLPYRFATDTIENPVDLIANIRLSNRSKTREIKNIKASSNRDDFLGKDQISIVKRAWKFVGGLFAEEEQTISSAAFARDAKVIVLKDRGGAYSALNETLHVIIAEFNKKYPDQKIDDKILAQLIKNKIKGEEFDLEDVDPLDVDKLNQFVTDMTYLLFGCEVARNPASLVMHQMMLDLIIAGELEWKNAIYGKLEMPMAAGEIVQGARASHSLFGKFMPWAYKYEGDENVASMNSLFQRESALFEKWLTHKKINPIFAEEALVLACKEWYGIEMESVVYGADAVGKKRNPAEFAIKKWIKKVLENDGSCEDNDEQFLYDGNYQLLHELVTNFDYIPTSGQKELLSSAIIGYLSEFDEWNDEPSKSEKEFLKILAQKKLFNFTSKETLIKLMAKHGFNSALEIMIPEFSKEFLEKEIRGSTLLCIASNRSSGSSEFPADKTSQTICELLISRGVNIDDRTKETEFYKTNSDVFAKKLEMPTVKAALEELEAKQDSPSKPSVIPEPVKHLQLSPRSSRSSSISDY